MTACPAAASTTIEPPSTVRRTGCASSWPRSLARASVTRLAMFISTAPDSLFRLKVDNAGPDPD
eukprot:4283724-Pyramimonas_sp.AAC.1